MTKKIYKFEAWLGPKVEFQVPVGAQVLDIQIGNGGGGRNLRSSDSLFLWAMVDSGVEALETRTFRTFPTGAEIDPRGLAYHSTIQENVLVWHIFEDLTESLLKGKP